MDGLRVIQTQTLDDLHQCRKLCRMLLDSIQQMNSFPPWVGPEE